jgi:hypothetical protein
MTMVDPEGVEDTAVFRLDVARPGHAVNVLKPDPSVQVRGHGGIDQRLAPADRREE